MAERTGWRDVPMPPSVAALPRSAGGLPVPYVASWEGEEEMRIEECPFVHNQRAVVPVHRRVGETRPVFGIMEPQRQREVTALYRCQVCRKQLPPIGETPRRTFLWLPAMLREPDTYRGHRVCLEPWVCDDCLVYALRVCPGMVASPVPVDIRADLAAHVTRYPIDVLAVWTANLIAVIGRVKGESGLRVQGAVTYCKIEPLRYRRLRGDHLFDPGVAEVRRQLELKGPPDG